MSSGTSYVFAAKSYSGVNCWGDFQEDKQHEGKVGDVVLLMQINLPVSSPFTHTKINVTVQLNGYAPELQTMMGIWPRSKIRVETVSASPDDSGASPSRPPLLTHSAMS